MTAPPPLPSQAPRPDGALAALCAALEGRYRVLDAVGAGGMATVYAADDLRHRRKVALKVLRPEVAAALGAERFLQEIETSAGLRHPHILPLYDSGEAAGQLYFVMPLVEGESLRARLEREGPLPVDEAVRLVREVADALHYAHGQGVVHRDIKPENILLEGGHAVVADFGIACGRRAPASAMGATQPGVVLGTPRYMSPEQAGAESGVDGRSDLYSLACTLFEMLTGQPPFGDGPMVRMVFQHLAAPAPAVTALRPEVPTPVDAALRRALAKDPAARQATAAEFAADLVRTGARPMPAPSVAVLPFVNLSADPDNAYFADGITEDVIAQLAGLRALRVVSRSSVMPFRDRATPLREVASRLHVGAILDGSVRRHGSRVRIVAQLLDGASESHLWGETFDRDITDIFAIQAEVARAIAGALAAELSPGEEDRLARTPTRDMLAYQLHLQGRHHLIRFTEPAMRQAVGYFEAAIARDPHFAPAHAARAMALTELAEVGAVEPTTAHAEARASARRAMELDPGLADAHTIAAYLRMVVDFDWAGAEAGFRRALALSPSAADACDLLARLCSSLGRFDEAIALCERARELDPLAHRSDLATAYLRANRWEDAARVAREAIELDRSDVRPHFTLGWALIGMGQIEDGIAAMEGIADRVESESLWLAQLGQAYGLAGRRDEALAILGRLEAADRAGYVGPYQLAYIHTGLGNHERALDLLEEALEQRAGAIYGIKGSFLFAPLREHPRYRAILRRLELPE